MHIAQVRMGVNYGLNKVRFTAPVPVGSRLRARMRLDRARPFFPAIAPIVAKTQQSNSRLIFQTNGIF